MAKMRTSPWRKISVSLAELCLDTTLRCGQSFRYGFPEVARRYILNMSTGGRSLKMMSGPALYTAGYYPYVKMPPTFITEQNSLTAHICP